MPSKLGLNSETWTYRFKHDGRRYTLVKRKRSRNGVWWLDVVIKGRRIARTLETVNAVEAEARAIRSYITPARAEQWRLMGPTPRVVWPKLVEIMAAYVGLSHGRVMLGTVINNVNALRMVVRRGLGREGATLQEVGETSTAALNGALVSKFEDVMREQGKSQRSVCSYLKQARSLFNHPLVKRYEDAGLKLPPGFEEFMTREVARPPRTERERVPTALIDKTLEASKSLWVNDPAAYIAWLLGLCSLRRGEIAVMRWDWLHPNWHEGGATWSIIVPRHHAKSKCARTIPVDPQAFKQLDRYHTVRCAQEDKVGRNDFYVLPGAERRVKFRCGVIFRRVNVWMRDLGWTTAHTLHEMRALSLSWIRDAHGLDSAQSVAGHSDQRTTQQHYVGQKDTASLSVQWPYQFIGGDE